MGRVTNASGGTTGTAGCPSRILADVADKMVRVRNKRLAMALWVSIGMYLLRNEIKQSTLRRQALVY